MPQTKPRGRRGQAEEVESEQGEMQAREGEATTATNRVFLYSFANRARKLPFVSIGVRFLANVEALNMVETAGNLNRHRTVPIVIFRDGKYSIKWYPALSGESLAHALQYNLSILEKSTNSNNIKLCYFCSIGEFLKHTALDFYKVILNNLSSMPDWEKDLINNYDKMKEQEIEKAIVTNCIVEDLGGFVVATAATQGTKGSGVSVRRTSAFQFSYAIPTEDAIEEGATSTDVQMQVRMANIAQSLANAVNYKETPIQAPFNKEIASTTYSFIFNFDADKVCVSSYTNSELCDESEKKRRAKLLLDALKLVIDGNFGASKSRYNPFIEREVIVAAVSWGDILFTVSSPAMKLEDFINETLERAYSYVKEFTNLKISIYVWANAGKRITINGTELKQYLSSYITSKQGKQVDNTNRYMIGDNLTIEYIESYSHMDLIEKIKGEIG